jgi:competence protein ComEA
LIGAQCFAAVDVNLASEAELDGIKGLGPSSTARILKARESGPFKDWSDLMRRVKGIKPSLAAKLSEAGLTVADAPYIAPDAQKSAKP